MADTNNYVNNLSYTNKDFTSIYRELLEIVPQVTNKWNPQNSNESDPGVVLLKLLAVLGDKLNYNVDKNILEEYPLSVTQESNARQLYDSLGYSMHWYQSATTSVSMKYTGSDISDGTVSTITVPPFTMVANDAGTIVYTLLGTSGLSGAVFSAKNEILSVNAIEGVINQYAVSGNTDITLANLDSDLRLYFSESQIAENGIFICNSGQSNFDEWQKINNLESNSLNSAVYKFGVLPNSTTCYIQFPQDIANLIGDGLNIYYVTSQGSNGNISANVLTNFYSTFEITTDSDSTLDLTDSFIINNSFAAVDGTDTETIESAYNNYKKLVGTFDTLVTCRDYENALYQYSSALSNVVVSDRTNDINYSDHIVTNNGSSVKKILKVKSLNDVPLMTAFDIGIYALYPMGNVYNASIYNRSFTPSQLSASEFDSLVQENKSCQHDFIDTYNDALLYLFKNFYTLSGKVLTNYKVTEAEASDIEENIRQALFSNFNAHSVTFGEAPEFDNLLDVIKNADTRIREVILNEPQYTLKLLDVDDTIGSFATASAIQMNEDDPTWVRLVARLVLNGTVQLYKFDRRFDYDFGQIGDSNSVRENIHSITTEVILPYEDPDSISSTYDSLKTGYLLRENENIQVYGPSLVSTKTFTTYVEYEFVGNASFDIAANTNYQLRANESLRLSYLDSNNVRQTYSNNSDECLYQEGAIICCSFDVTGNQSGTLTASQTIDIKKINQTELSTSSFGKYIYCYWITNSEDAESRDILFNEGQLERILDNNEYFIYTDASKTDIVILGSGTKLVRTTASSAVVNTSAVSRADINSEGSGALSETDWYVWSTQESGSLTVIENQIFAFGEGTYVKLVISTNINECAVGVTELSSSSITDISIASSTFKSAVSNVINKYRFVYDGAWKLNSATVTLSNYGIVLTGAPAVNDNFTVEIGALTNEAVQVSGVEYGTSATTLVPITSMDLASYSWEARSRLNLNASSEYVQQLQPRQFLTINYPVSGTLTDYTFTGWDNDCLLFNENLFMVGGPDLDVAVTDYAGNTDYTLAVYNYQSSPVMSAVENSGTYYRIPSSDIVYGQGTKYKVPVQINAKTSGTPYEVDYSATPTNEVTLNDIPLAEGSKFFTTQNLLVGSSNYITSPTASITIKNVVLPFTFEASKKYIIPVFKTGSNYTFTLASDNADVTFKPIVGTTTSNQITSSGMYYVTPIFTNSVTTCSRMIITYTLAEGGDSDSTDYLDIYKPIVLDASQSYGDQLVSAAMLSKVEAQICGHNIFGTTSSTELSPIDSDNQFDYSYEVPETDLIDTDTIASSDAFWSSNNPFTRFTIGQLNTRDSSIQVASSSKTLR